MGVRVVTAEGATGTSGGPTPSGVGVPAEVRVAFAHAAVQHLADASGLDVLHVKGAALDPTLVPGRAWTDADVLVRPAHVRSVVEGLRGHGWALVNRFAYGSSFEHSATLAHRDFGLVDVHRLFPGAGPTPEAAFDALWAQRSTVELGGLTCTVPGRDAQACLLLLHAARAGASPKAAHDVQHLWTDADDAQRRAVLDWVDRLDAHLGFSVLTGTLDDHADDPAYDLWRVASRGGTRVEEWRARVRAARGLRGKAAVAARSVLVNVEHLALVRGHPVTRREVAAEFVRRPVRALREVAGPPARQRDPR